MKDADTDLIRATHHVAAGKAIVARQRALIAKLKAAGHSTWEHERALTVFTSTLKIFEDHECELRRTEHGSHQPLLTETTGQQRAGTGRGLTVPDSRTGAMRYHDRAKLLRRLAENAGSPEMRTRYLEIAEHYIALAETEERLTTRGVTANSPGRRTS